jgi:(2Fe-2S) ferredoxin
VEKLFLNLLFNLHSLDDQNAGCHGRCGNGPNIGVVPSHRHYEGVYKPSTVGKILAEEFGRYSYFVHFITELQSQSTSYIALYSASPEYSIQYVRIEVLWKCEMCVEFWITSDKTFIAYVFFMPGTSSSHSSYFY